MMCLYEQFFLAKKQYMVYSFSFHCHIMSAAPRMPLVEASSYRGISSSNPFWYGNLIHLYLDLKLGMTLEGAEGVEKARKAQKYIREAAEAAQVVCDVFAGQVLEIHGKTLHLGLEVQNADTVEDQMKAAAALFHALLEKTYRGNGPESWRMGADHGFTLTVSSESVHHDTSLVSLSPAANLPAKKLGKKGVIGSKQLGANVNGSWGVEDLPALVEQYRASLLAEQEQVRMLGVSQASVFNFSAFSEGQLVTAQAAPVGEPSEENLFSVHAMIMSADLDGFTARVAEAANGSVDDKRRLAEDFLETMRRAAAFADARKERMIQFPFAGDNAIFAIVSSTADDYERLKKVVPIETALAWEDQFGDRARHAGYRGWAQVAAGGQKPHGNAKGNLHVSGIRLNGRRFLIGIGPGMRYAREGFAQVNPSAKHMAIWKDDIVGLHPFLGEVYEPCRSENAEVSAVYKMATFENLRVAMARLNQEKFRSVSVLGENKILLATGQVAHRPHCAEI
jgi:hypothetical protein